MASTFPTELSPPALHPRHFLKRGKYKEYVILRHGEPSLASQKKNKPSRISDFGPSEEKTKASSSKNKKQTCLWADLHVVLSVWRICAGREARSAGYTPTFVTLLREQLKDSFWLLISAFVSEYLALGCLGPSVYADCHGSLGWP